MNRGGLALMAFALGLCGCAEPSTELVLEAPGEPGAVVSYAGQSVTLDATGHGVLHVPQQYTLVSGFGASTGEVEFVDADQRPLVLHIAWHGAAIDAPPVCVPYQTSRGRIERAELRLRRVRADGSCRVVNPWLVENGVMRTGTYEAQEFDDAPCGPLASTP